MSVIVQTDIDQDNGVVHVIDRTLVPAAGNIVQIVVAAKDADPGAEFTQLFAALDAVENDMLAADLVTVLSGDGPFTVFAPTDAAFQTLYDAVPDADQSGGANDISDLVAAAGGLETIATVLQYHVVGARIFSTDIPNLPSNTVTPVAGGTWTLNVANLTIQAEDMALMLNLDDARITGTDILATNGVIHTIDQVILP